MERIDRLERQVRTLRTVVIILGCALLATFTMAGRKKSTFDGADVIQADRIIAREIALVDANNESLVLMHTRAGYGLISFLAEPNGRGHSRLTLTGDPGGAGLTMLDPDGQSRVSLISSRDTSYLWLNYDAEKPLVSAMASDGIGVLDVSGRDGKTSVTQYGVLTQEK